MADTASTDMAQIEQTGGGILPGMTSLAPLKQVGILVAIAASIALGVFVALWSNDPPMRPIENLTPEASMDVINFLEQQQIPYDIDTTGRILVPQSRYQRIQMELGAQGIAVQGANEDPYLKKDSGFGVSQRMEKARLLRNQEIGLKKTLEQFNGVKAVKVHLAIPRESSFIKNRRKPSASVLLNLYSRGALSEEQVDAMVDLVSGSIPNLERNRVTITDQFGRLYHSGSMTSSQRQSSREMSVVRERQEDIKSRIEQILAPLVGADAYTVQVNVDMDFTKKEQTLQTFNPDLPAIRSERTMEDSSGTNNAAGVPGALTNQPPGAANIPAQGAATAGQNATDAASNKRAEAERNYELDTTISHILPQVGVVNRVSASIALDYVNDPNNPGQKIARAGDELGRITRLIQAAIGYNIQRGDLVSVESIPFTTVEALPVPAEPAFYEGEMFHTMLKPVIGLILGLVLIFGVLRPTIKRLAATPVASGSKGLAEAGDSDLAGLAEESIADGGLQDDQVVLAGHDSLELPPPSVGEVKKLEQAKGVVNNNPTLVAQLVKNWIEDDG